MDGIRTRDSDGSSFRRPVCLADARPTYESIGTTFPGFMIPRSSKSILIFFIIAMLVASLE